MLPTNHGFDEFFGNLYHLNAEEEPELPDYPNEKEFPNFRNRFGPRGVMHSWATDVDDPTEEPRWGKVGKQRVTDTGPLTKKRMETCDDDFVAAAKEFMKKANDAGKPFFVWLNTTHMHLKTHTKPESLGQAGRWQSPYHDTMIDHDKNIGQMLDYLDELALADNTFVMYSTDNGPHMNSWPDGGMTPFRSEKNTNWEGAFRVPMIVRWPGKIAPGQVSNEIVQHHDWFPTFLAMAGDPGVVDKLKTGYQAIGRTYKNHIDGYNLVPYLTGQAKDSPRKFFMYLSDDGDVLGMRYDNWKVAFMEQRCQGTLLIWGEPFTRLRIPKIYNLRTDPFERADETSNSYWEWYIDHIPMIYGAQALAAQWAATFKDFPPIQKPNTFTLDQALAMMHEAALGCTEPRVRLRAAGFWPAASGAREGAGAEARNPRRSEVSRSEEVRDFYERMPYPAPLTSLDEYRDLYKNPNRRRAEFHLIWPARRPRGNQKSLSLDAALRRPRGTRFASLMLE